MGEKSPATEKKYRWKNANSFCWCVPFCSPPSSSIFASIRRIIAARSSG